MEKLDIKCWGIIEFKNKKLLAGFITTAQVLKKEFLKIQVYNAENVLKFEQVFIIDPVRSITPCSEELAKQMAEEFKPELHQRIWNELKHKSTLNIYAEIAQNRIEIETDTNKMIEA